MGPTPGQPQAPSMSHTHPGGRSSTVTSQRNSALYTGGVWPRSTLDLLGIILGHDMRDREALPSPDFLRFLSHLNRKNTGLLASEAGGSGFESRRAHPAKSSESFDGAGPFFPSENAIGPGCSTDVANRSGTAAEVGESLDVFGTGVIRQAGFESYAATVMATQPCLWPVST